MAHNEEIEIEVSISPELIDGIVQAVIEQVRVSAMVLDEIISATQSIISSYAAMIDPDEGTPLTFFQKQEANGMKCARIEYKDGLPEIKY